MEQCKLLFLRTRNPTKKIRETLIKKVVPSMDSVSKDFKMLYRKSREYFDNFRHTFNKDMTALAKDFLVKNWYAICNQIQTYHLILRIVFLSD